MIHSEVLLPERAPPEYADRAALWNSVESAEKRYDSQLARRIIIALPKELPHEQNIRLIRQFCQEQFVSKGMCCDYAVHDEGDGNPHAHVLLTMRGLDEHGKWFPKSKSEFVLDENGQRIRQKNGRWKCRKVNTVDWNDQKYCEVWRHEWELLQNKFLQQAGRTERVDMRSFERQQSDFAPTVHMGAAITNMERKGISTDIGDLNREITNVNQLIESIHSLVQRALDWIRQFQLQKRTKNPQEKTVAGYLWDYAEQRQSQRESWHCSKLTKLKAYSKDLNRINEANRFFSENGIITLTDLEHHLKSSYAKIAGQRDKIKQCKTKIRTYESIINCRKAIETNVETYKAYSKLKFKKPREKFYAEHKQALDAYNRATRYLKKYAKYENVSTAALQKKQKKLEVLIQQETDSLSKEQHACRRLRDGRHWIQQTIGQEKYARLTDPNWKPSVQARLSRSQRRDIGESYYTRENERKHNQDIDRR